MARLCVGTKEHSDIIRINTKNDLSVDVDLIDIDYLTLTCNSNFFNQAYQSNCLSLDIYNSSNKKVFIKQDNQILNAVMFDDDLKTVINYMLENNQTKIDINLEPLKKDMDLLFKMLKDPFILNKLTKHFKNDNIVGLFNDYNSNNLRQDEIIAYFTEYKNYRMLREYFRKNIYYLCITLDVELKKYKVLTYYDKSRLDEYTMEFKDSNDIRNEYKDEISKYLDENRDYLNSLSRKSSGSIVILRHEEYSMVRTKVLYSDTKSRINNFVKDLKLVKKVSAIDYDNKKKSDDYNTIFTPHQGKIIFYKKPNIKSGYTAMLNDWKKQLFEKKDYDTIRKVLSIIDGKNVFYNTSNKPLAIPVENKIDMYDIRSSEFDFEKEEFLYEDEIEQITGVDNDYLYDGHYILMKEK